MFKETAGKSETSRQRILDTALELFTERGFDEATMREVATRAGMATGAAYYYYASKDAIVMAFYERASRELEPLLAAALEKNRGFERSLRALIEVKLAYFVTRRGVLRALLRNGADPAYPLSPFSEATRHIREADVRWFRALLDGAGVRVPRDLAPHMPETLWLFQMGILYFWVTDESPGQQRTLRLLELGSKAVAALLRLSALPFTRPLRKTVVGLIETAKGGAA